MTEADAKMKWCPFIKGENGDGESEASCLGAVCMAWRTRHQWLDNAQQDPDWISYAPYAFEPGPGQERDDGYCGLVGAPQ